MTPEMTCSACRELLLWQTAGQLTPSERAAVERHVAICPDCQREASLWSAVAQALADDERAIPPDDDSDAAWQALRDRLDPGAPFAAAQRRSIALAEIDAAPTSVSATPTPRRFRRPALAAPAAVILVALIAALFAGFGARLRQSRTPAVSATATPTACASSALRATIPANARLSDLSMTSARTGWAVGSIVSGSDPSTASYQTLLLGFQNCQWAPEGASIASAELESVSMASATDGWAVGVTNPAANDSALLALHYTGGAWQRVSVPAAPTGVVGAKVRMTSAGDGWMLLDLGGRHVTPYQKQYSYVLLHYQGGVWTPTPLSFDQSGTSILWSIAASSADDCWIVGYDTSDADSFDVAHYHQGVWSLWSGSQLGVRYAALYAVVPVAPNDIWIAGQYPYHDASGDHTGPLVLHFDGTHWTRAPLSDYQDQTNDHALMTLAVQPSGEVWAFTQEPPIVGLTHDSIAHDANEAAGASGAWAWMAAPDRVMAIDSVDFVSNSEAYGLAGVWRNGTPNSAILHYSDGVWSVLPSA